MSWQTTRRLRRFGVAPERPRDARFFFRARRCRVFRSRVGSILLRQPHARLRPRPRRSGGVHGRALPASPWMWCARKMQVVDAGYLRDFGGVKRFSGPAVTIQCFENNPLVRQALGEPGEGRVLVVDGGGSTRCALLGDNLAAMAANNGWSGVIINGCLRDTEDIAKTSVGVKAIAPHPVKSSKRDRACATSPSRSRGSPSARETGSTQTWTACWSVDRKSSHCEGRGDGRGRDARRPAISHTDTRGADRKSPASGRPPLTRPPTPRLRSRPRARVRVRTPTPHPRGCPPRMSTSTREAVRLPAPA